MNGYLYEWCLRVRQWSEAPCRVSAVTMWSVLLCVMSVQATAAARNFTENDHYRLPRLYHLDNYERCLAQPQGRYCTATFRITAASEKPSAAYKLIKEYSSETRHFDRTLISRGYCLNARCPTTENNVTRHLEQCVEQHALAPGLKAHAETYSCNTAATEKRRVNTAIDVPQRVFLVVVGVLLVFNMVGTLYDVGFYGKNKLVLAWSMRMNWQRLVATHKDGDPKLTVLAPIQGVRVLLMAVVLVTHATEILHKFFLYNPEFLEQVLLHPVTMLVRSGSAIIQSFYVISNFLFAYSLLLHSKTHKIGLRHLPICILQRVVRLSPIHLLGVGFAATWWKLTGDGPQWGVLTAESDICRRKFWAHAFYVHNFVNADEHCLVPTWFLAVDMQLFVIASTLMLYLMQTKRNPIPILTSLFFGSCLLIGALVYINEWKSLLYIMEPENIRTTFRGVHSFNQFYISPWGSLPGCFLGLLLAHIHFNMQEQGYNINIHKWFIRLYHISVPIHYAIFLTGNTVLKYRGHIATSLYTAVERPLFAILGAIVLLGIVNNVDNSFRRLMGWRGWVAMGRMSLSVLTLHWLFNLRLVATRRTLTELSVFNIGADVISTFVWTHLAAIPFTIMVESPLIRSTNALLT